VWSESSFFSKSGDQIMTLEAYSELHAYNIWFCTVTAVDKTNTKISVVSTHILHYKLAI
jgi:hypothetical protein